MTKQELIEKIMEKCLLHHVINEQWYDYFNFSEEWLQRILQDTIPEQVDYDSK